jgi:regulator of protease activity HflC (stomatin/prohibitin superfamily)
MPAMLDIVLWGKVFSAAESIINVENLADSVLKLVLGIARVVMSGMSFETINQSKESVADDIKKRANVLFGGWGYQIVKLQIQRIKPSPEILKAQEQIQVSNKKRESTRIDAEVRAEVMSILDKADPDMRRRGLQALEGFKGSVNLIGGSLGEIIEKITGKK